MDGKQEEEKDEIEDKGSHVKAEAIPSLGMVVNRTYVPEQPPDDSKTRWKAHPWRAFLPLGKRK